MTNHTSAPPLPNTTATTPAPAKTQFQTGRTDRFERLTATALPVAIALLAAYFWWKAPGFFTWDNWISLSVQSAALATISIPSAILLMQGHVDLSVGSNLAFCAVIAGLSFDSVSIPAVVALTLAVGAAVGAVNGTLVSALGMSPIVVTLGTLTVLRGLAQLTAPNPVFGFPEGFLALGTGKLLGLPYLTWIAASVVVVGALVMALLPLGRQVVAIGVNSRAAYLVGVRVRLIGVLTYVAVGAATGAAALITISRLNSAPSGTLGVGMELQVLTAVLLGGIPFTGGKGSVLRVALGVWLLGMLRNGLILMNVGTEISQIVTGSVLIIAAALELVRVRRAN